MRVLKSVLLWGLIFNAQAYAASFDCGKASTAVEKMICGSEELSRLDDELVEHYVEAKEYSKGNKNIKQLKADQEAWLHIRNSCINIGCIKSAYLKRNAYLNMTNESSINESLSISISQERAKKIGVDLVKKKVEKYPTMAGWDYYIGYGDFHGADDNMCKALKKYMNTKARKWQPTSTNPLLMENNCISTAKLFPSFSEPPWTDLNPNEHKSLIINLLRYKDEGSKKYFSIEKSDHQKEDSYYEELARDFISQGGRVQYWKTRLLNFSTDPHDLTLKKLPFGDQNIIQLRYPKIYSNKTSHDGCLHSNWSGSIFVVTDNLDEPDPNINEGDLPPETLLIYEGKRVLYDDNFLEIEISRDEGDGVFGPACTLTYPYYKFKQGK